MMINSELHKSVLSQLINGLELKSFEFYTIQQSHQKDADFQYETTWPSKPNAAPDIRGCKEEQATSQEWMS